MPVKPLFELEGIDLDRIEYGIEEVRKMNPHRFEFEQVTGIVAFQPELKRVVGLRHLREDEFWVRGHIPGNPLFPGVLMLESAAQVCSFYSGKVAQADGFLGLGGMDEVRFRGVVKPGEKLYILGVERVLTPSRCQFDTQGVVNGKVVFEARILGVRLRA
jgi:3-hydroxyacyl-[acyl-carrier-protein] dehydratase